MPNGPPPDRVERAHRAINTNTDGAKWPGLGRPSPGPPQTLSEKELRRNRFCIGKKRGRKYICGSDEVSEEEKSKAVELLSETVKRIWRWRVWDDWWIEEWMDEWLEKRDRLETQLRGRYSNETINDLLRLVDEFISYNEKFLNYWRDIGGEVRKLIEDLMSGGTEVIIRGEGVAGVSVHHGRITLDVNRTSNNSITIHLMSKGLKGVMIRAPDIFVKTMSKEEYAKFVNEIFMALKEGLEETDGTVEGGKAAMGTAQIWQAIIWALLYPGVSRVRINAVNVNENNVSILWHLKSRCHDSLKGKILNDAEKLGEKGILAFMLTAIFGDGCARIAKTNGRYNTAVISMAMSNEAFNAWEPLLERLREMGFKWAKPKTGKAIEVPFYGSNAINLARAMISVLPPILRDILDALSFEKWLNLRRIAEMEVKWRRGEMSVDIVGYRFTVSVQKKVMLERKVKDDVEAKKVIETLRAMYGDEFTVNIHKNSKYRLVVIPMYVFERYDDIKAQVIEVLCRRLGKIKDEKKRQIIVKHLMRLTAPTKGAAAGFICALFNF